MNGIVYEVADGTGKVQLYTSYVGKMRPWTATADHNGSSLQNNNTVNNTVSNVYVSRPFKGDYTMDIIPHYWLKEYRNLHRANNLKDFLKVFKENTHAAISYYVKENNIDFGSEPDLVKLVNFCNSL